MNNQQQIKVRAAASAGLDFHLPATPNEMLRDWIRAVDLQKVGKQLPITTNSRNQRQRIPIRFFKPKSKRVKVSFAKPVSPQ